MNDFMAWHDSCTLDRRIARMIDRLEFNLSGVSMTPFSVFTRAWLDVVPNQETFENNRERSGDDNDVGA